MKKNSKNKTIKRQPEKRKPSDKIVFSDKIHRYGSLIISVVVVLLYSQIITFDFTGFEDDYLISKNIKNLSNIENLDDIFIKNSFLSEYNLGFYRPLQTLTYMVNAIIGGNNPGIYYLTNLILHCLTCCFIFLLFKKLKYNPNIALSVAMLYAVHPLFVHAVVWIPSRGDLLLCLFCVLSFIFLIKYSEAAKSETVKRDKFLFNSSFIFHLLCLLLAGLSKETALLFPVILFFWYFILNKNKILSGQGITLIISWVVIIGLCYFLRLATVEDIMSKEDFGIIPFFNNLATIPEVIGKFIIPINIQLMPNFNTINTSIGLIVLLFLVTFYFLKKDKNNLQILFGLLWFAILILPGMFYGRKFTDSDHLFDYQDHRNYLTMIGMVIILIELFSDYISKLSKRQLISSAFVIFIIFSAITFFNSKNYNGSITFFDTAIKDNPKISGLYFIRAGIKKDAGRINEALLDYNQTIRYNPEHADAYNNRASIRGMLGNYDGALEDFNRAIKLNPKITESYYNRALVKKILGDLKGAIDDYNKVIIQNPNDYLTLIERGTAFLKLKDYSRAIEDFEMIIKLNPNNTEVYLNLGIAKYQLQMFDDACKEWLKSAELGNQKAKQMIENYCR